MGTFVHRERYDGKSSLSRRLGVLGDSLIQIDRRYYNDEEVIVSGRVRKYASEVEANREILARRKLEDLSSSITVTVEPLAGMRLQTQESVSPEIISHVDKAFQEEAIRMSAPIFRALEEKWEPSVFVCVPHWEAWCRDWEWRAKLKAEFEARPHGFRDTTLVVALDEGSHLKLIRWGGGGVVGGQWFIAIEKENRLIINQDIVDTAVKLWEPHQAKSPYHDLNQTIRAAEGLV